MTAALALSILCPWAVEHAHHVEVEAHRYRIPPVVLVAVAFVETGCRQGKVGAHGERGAWQIKPDGSAALGCGITDPAVLALPAASVHCAAKHLARLRRMCHRSGWHASLSIYSANRTRCSSVPTEYSRKVLAYVDEAERSAKR